VNTFPYVCSDVLGLTLIAVTFEISRSDACFTRFGANSRLARTKVTDTHMFMFIVGLRMSLPTVSQDLRIAIAQARQAKGLSQKDLAAKLMIPAKVRRYALR
jgi:ribosome-binding protein aMBF1 (putative translation factor)